MALLGVWSVSPRPLARAPLPPDAVVRTALATARLAAVCLTLALLGPLTAPGAADASSTTSAQPAQSATTIIAARATAVERQSVTILAAVQAAAASRSTLVLLRLAHSVYRTQLQYWSIAPFVHADPSLRGDDLGDLPADTSATPDGPLTKLAASVRAAVAHPTRPRGALVGEARATLDAAGRLAVALRAATLPVPRLQTGLAGALALVAADGRAWAQSPRGRPPDLPRARATLTGAKAVLGAMAPDALLAHRLAEVGRLLGGTADSGPAWLAAPELAWQATAATTELHRGDVPSSGPALAAQTIGEDVFDAQAALAAGRTGAARVAMTSARRALAAGLPQLAAGPAGVALAAAARAATDGNARALAGARGRLIAAIVAGAYRRTLAATAEGDVPSARRYAAVRDFGPTAAGGNGSDSERALAELSAGRTSRGAAVLQIRRDVLGGLQRRTIWLVGQVVLDDDLGLGNAAAQAAALARGYWSVLGPVYALHAGPAAGRWANEQFSTLARPASRLAAGQVLAGFTAAPPTAAQRSGWVRALVTAVRFTIARDCTTATQASSARQMPGTAGGPPLIARLVDDLRPGLAGPAAVRLTDAERQLAGLPGAQGSSSEELAARRVVSRDARARCVAAAADVAAVYPNWWRGAHGPRLPAALDLVALAVVALLMLAWCMHTFGWARSVGRQQPPHGASPPGPPAP